MNNSVGIALMTGGSRSLGRTTVKTLAQRGVSAVLTYNAHFVGASEVVVRVEARGSWAIASLFSTDETDTFNGSVSAFQKTLAEPGADRFRYLINSAGNVSGMGLLSATETEFSALYRVYAKSIFFLSQELLPLLAGDGRIISIPSGLTHIVMASWAPHAIVKPAAEALTRYMALELGSHATTANYVAPGAIAIGFSGGMVWDNP